MKLVTKSFSRPISSLIRPITWRFSASSSDPFPSVIAPRWSTASPMKLSGLRISWAIPEESFPRCVRYSFSRTASSSARFCRSRTIISLKERVSRPTSSFPSTGSSCERSPAATVSAACASRTTGET